MAGDGTIRPCSLWETVQEIHNYATRSSNPSKKYMIANIHTKL